MLLSEPHRQTSDDHRCRTESCLSLCVNERNVQCVSKGGSIPWILHSDLLDPEWTVWVFCSQFTVSHTYHTLVRFFCVLLTSVLALCDFSTFSLSLCPSFLLSVTAGLGDHVCLFHSVAQEEIATTREMLGKCHCLVVLCFTTQFIQRQWFIYFIFFCLLFLHPQWASAFSAWNQEQ